MSLVKRETLNSKAAESKSKSEFIKSHLPELESLGNRQKYYIDYEFPKKQEKMVKFWQRALDYAFRYHFDSSAASFRDIYDLFIISQTMPRCLEPIIVQLIRQKEVYVMKNGDSLEPLIAILKERENKEGFTDKIWKLFKKQTPDKVEIDPMAQVIMIDLFRLALTKVDEKKDEMFEHKMILSQPELLDRMEEVAHSQGFEARQIINLLIHTKKMFCFKDKGMTYYHIHPLDDNEKRSFLNGIIIDKQMILLNSRIEDYAQKETEKANEALRFHRAGKKQEALNALAQKRIFRKIIDELNQKYMVLHGLRTKLEDAQHQKDFSTTLRQFNDIMKSVDRSNELLEQLDKAKEIDQDQEMLNREIQALNNNPELEDMYNELNAQDVKQKPKLVLLDNSKKSKNIAIEPEEKSNERMEKYLNELMEGKK